MDKSKEALKTRRYPTTWHYRPYLIPRLTHYIRFLPKTELKPKRTDMAIAA